MYYGGKPNYQLNETNFVLLIRNNYYRKGETLKNSVCLSQAYLMADLSDTEHKQYYM